MKPAEYNNDEELKNLAPMLSSIEKKQVFSVPGNYFDSLSAQIMDRISPVPQLEEIPVSNPFTVPENYFDSLPLNIIKQIEAAGNKRFSLAGLLVRVLKPKYSLTLVAACFALFICVRFFEKPILMNVVQTTADNVSISEADVLSEVDENTLMNVVAEESAIVIKSNNKVSAEDKNVEDYIINNDIDVSDITKEL